MSAALKFCGRSNDLEMLKGRWRLASDVDNPSPQVVVVKAEPGVGKTRLVLEFYRWLSEQPQADTSGYWPDALSIVDRNLCVNPEPEDCKIRERQIPYLWWGIRALPHGRENSVGRGDAITTFDRYLEPHLVALLVREHVQRTGKALAWVWAEAAGDALVSELPELLKTAIPYFGLVAGVGKVIYKTQQVVREGIDYAGVDRALEKPHSRAETALANLERVFGPRRFSSVKTPGVIFLDDAQWISTDLTLPEFTDRLIRLAVTKKWPLMIIATHWRREFGEDRSTKSFAGIIRHARTGGADGGNSPAGLPGGYLEDASYCEIDLQPVDDLSSALRDCLPGLSGAQQAAILERVGGNPRFLEQIIAYLLEEEPGCFEDCDILKALTPEGFAKCLEETQDIEKVVKRRLRMVPPEVQEAICLASMQGMQFSNSLTEEFAQATINQSVREPLARAENPYSWVTGHGPGETRTVGEFADRLFFDVARQNRINLSKLRDEETLVGALRDILAARLDDTSLTEKLNGDDCALTYRLATNVFARSDETTDNARVLLALAHLAQLEESRYSFEGALDAASRFAALFSTALDARALIPTWAVRCCIRQLRSGGRLDDAMAILESSLALQRAHVAKVDTSDALSDLANTLLDAIMLSKDREDHLATSKFYGQHLEVRRELAERFKTPDTLGAFIDTLNRTPVPPNLGEDYTTIATEVFGEYLNIRRDLAESLKSPEAQSEFATTLKFAGFMAAKRGDHVTAAELFKGCLDILRDLATRLKTPDAIATLTRALNGIGLSMAGRGEHAAAVELYEEGYDILCDLPERLTTPETMSALANILSNTADLLHSCGDHSAATEFHKESLDIWREVATRLTSPDALGDLADAIDIAGIRRGFERHPETTELYVLSLNIRRDLAERLKTPDALSKLADALGRLGSQLRLGIGGNAGEAEHAESLDIRRGLAARLQTPHALRELANELNNARGLAQITGKNAAAAEFGRQNMDIRRDLAERLNTPESLWDYSASLLAMSRIALQESDSTLAMTFLSEGQEIAAKLPSSCRGKSLVPDFEQLHGEINSVERGKVHDNR